MKEIYEHLAEFWHYAVYTKSQQGIYNVLIGCDGEMLSPQEQKKQLDFVHWSQIEGREIFDENFAPYKTFKNDNEWFCRAASKNITRAYFEGVKHRLYFNFDEDRMDFVQIFVEKCNARKVPFSLKWHKSIKRRDNLVVYCTDDNIADLARILSEIKEEFPQFATPKELPMSAENFGWFAYGPELESMSSYNRLVADTIESACKNPEIWNSMRGKMIMTGTLKSFASELVKHSTSVMSNGVSHLENMQAIEKLKKQIEDNFLMLAKDLLTPQGRGFVVGEKGENCLDTPDGMERPIKVYEDDKTGAKVEIYPSGVVEALVSLVKKNVLVLDGVDMNTPLDLRDNYDQKITLGTALKYSIRKSIHDRHLVIPEDVLGILSMAGIDNPNIEEQGLER